jgi:hypothetical protein
MTQGVLIFGALIPDRSEQRVVKIRDSAGRIAQLAGAFRPVLA